jgi:hypothetical protein
MYLPSLTDDELVRYAYQSENALTSTELERELASRLEALLDGSSEQIAEIVDEYDLKLQHLRELAEAFI